MFFSDENTFYHLEKRWHKMIVPFQNVLSLKKSQEEKDR